MSIFDRNFYLVELHPGSQFPTHLGSFLGVPLNQIIRFTKILFEIVKFAVRSDVVASVRIKVISEELNQFPIAFANDCCGRGCPKQVVERQVPVQGSRWQGLATQQWY